MADLATRQRPWHVPMTGRDPAEAHRAATPLELLFDLCFVIAVAQAASGLHHDLADGELGHGIVSYLVVFFTIWWPWMNFTWFASAYDTDDVQYRLLTFVQITGVLVVAAGVPAAFDDLDFRVAVVGYVIMRVGLVAQWLRAAREDPAGRPAAIRFAIGVGLIQIGWVLRLVLGSSPPGLVAFAVLAALELAVPMVAERAGRPTPWNAAHIVERYGLFTIIVLGECLLATTTAIQAASDAGVALGSVLTVAAGGLLLVFGLWWAYFKHPPDVGHERGLLSMLAWGYGHYFVFAAVAALGAGLQVAAESTHVETDLAPSLVTTAVAVPVVVYLVVLALLNLRGRDDPIRVPIAVATAVIAVITVAATWTGVPVAVLAIGLVVAGLVAYTVAAMNRAAGGASAT